MRTTSALFALSLLILLPAPASGVARGTAAKDRTPSRQPRKQDARPGDVPRRGNGELVSASSFRQETLEELVFGYVNAERRKHGLHPFTPDRGLVRAARAHSGDMAARNFFSHDAPRGLLRKTGFGDRLRGNGVAASRLAENIAMLPLVRSRSTVSRRDERGRVSWDIKEARMDYDSLAAWAVQQWMESPGHRKNIFNPALGTMGIGVALGRKGQEDYVYLTQDFGGN